MDYFIDSLGLVMGGDKVSLAPGLQVRDRMIFDHANGARHIITSTTRDVLMMLGRGVEISQWHAYAAAVRFTDKEWLDLIAFLNSIGGIQIHRSWSAQFLMSMHRIQWQVQGVSMQTHAVRNSATIKGLAYAISLAMGQLAALTVIVSMLSIYSGLAEYAALAVYSIGILWITTFVHEYSHIAISKTSNHIPAVIVRGLRIGIIHHQLSRKRNILSALMGPLMGISFATFLGLAGWLAQSAVIVQSCFVVSVFHALSWLPSYGDGRVLKNEFTKFRKRGNYEKTSAAIIERKRTSRSSQRPI